MAVALDASSRRCPGCAQARGGGCPGGDGEPSNAPSKALSPWAFGTVFWDREPGLVCRNTWPSGGAGKQLSPCELEDLSTSKLALGLHPQEEQGSSQTWGSTVGVASPGLKSGIQGEPCSFWWQDSKSVSHSVSNSSE